MPTAHPEDERSPDDYRRVVLLIALLAVGFFIPSLMIAAVPIERWPAFSALAFCGGVVLAGSFVMLPRGSWLILPSVVANGVVTAVLGLVYADHYHEVGLLFSLLVAAHSIVHGLRAGIAMTVLGSILVPLATQSGQAVNLTDPIYAAIYLSGSALIPWAASRRARARLVEVHRHLEAVEEMEREAVHMLARAAEAKDDVTGDHVLRVGDISARLAQAAGQNANAVEDLRFAAMLHDVGKLHVPDSILMKPGPLDPGEWAIVRNHSVWGERILGGGQGFELARRIARSHHENWDGSGYPDGLRGESIPLAARIVHIADVFDALTSRRAYKPAWPIERSIAEIQEGAGRMFDPELVREFLQLLDAGGLTRTLIISPLGHHVELVYQGQG